MKGKIVTHEQRNLPVPSFTKAAAPVVLAASLVMAPRLAASDPNPHHHSDRAVADNRPASPAIQPRPITSSPQASQTSVTTPSPAVAPPVTQVTLGGIVFGIERINDVVTGAHTLAGLDAQSHQYRFAPLGTLPDGSPAAEGEGFFPDRPRHHTNITEVPGLFRAFYVHDDSGSNFGIQFERCSPHAPCDIPSGPGLTMLSRDAADFETAVRIASGQTVERMKEYVYHGIDNGHPYTGAVFIPADANGTPIRITTPEGITGYQSFVCAVTTDPSTHQNSYFRAFGLLVETR